MHSRQLLLDLRKNSKHWLLIIRYRFVELIIICLVVVVVVIAQSGCIIENYTNLSIAYFTLYLRMSK
jgi:hypothetical protein